MPGHDGAGPHAGAPDAGAPDAGAPDAGAPDAGAPDAGAPDDGAASDAVRDYAGLHVAAFNSAVERGDFGAFRTRFADDAVIRFENVPGAGPLEFAGRAAYTAAYADQPSGDQIVAAAARREDGAIVVPFGWRRDGGRGTMCMIVSAGLIARMTVQFD